MSFAGMLARLLALTLVFVCGCKDAPRERPAPQRQFRADEADEPLRAIEPPMPEPVPPVVEPAPPSAAQLPVAEDFQAETAATIMRANYRNELEALETEVHTDGL